METSGAAATATFARYPYSFEYGCKNYIDSSEINIMAQRKRKDIWFYWARLHLNKSVPFIPLYPLGIDWPGDRNWRGGRANDRCPFRSARPIQTRFGMIRLESSSSDCLMGMSFRGKGVNPSYTCPVLMCDIAVVCIYTMHEH